MNITSPHISNGHLSSTCHPLLLLSDTENVYLRENEYIRRERSQMYKLMIQNFLTILSSLFSMRQSLIYTFNKSQVQQVSKRTMANQINLKWFIFYG